MTTTDERVRLVAERIRQNQGDAIRAARSAAGLTHKQLADAITAHGLRCSDAAVSQWETGRATPRAVMQLAIAEVLDVSWLSLFSLADESL